MAANEINKAFFSLNDLLLYEDDLLEENYEKIPVNDIHNSAFIIFNEQGLVQYASNETITEKVFFEDMDLLGDYYSRRLFDVFETRSSNGKVNYNVFLSVYSEDNKVPKTEGFCVLDEKYHILEGDLFAGRNSLTEREFELLRGISQSNGMLEKYVYETNNGEERILAFLTLGITGQKYQRIIQSANRVWIVGVPCVLLVVILFTFLFSRRLKRYISPLNHAIVAYEKGQINEIDPLDVPREFHDTVYNFREMVRQLEQTRKENENLFQAKQRMIVDISHDLKTPLTVIQGYAKALSEGRVPDSKKAAYTDAIFSKAKLAVDMVNDLFLLAQMEHPDYQMDQQLIDFNEFVKSYFAEKYMEIVESGLDLQVDIVEERNMVLIDSKLMRRVLENLLHNALKYNPRGTTIYLSIRRCSQQIELCVADDGVGIAPEIAKNLFEPFVTGNSARTTGMGTGLGLSIAQKIVQMHHGEIQLVDPPSPPYHTEFLIVLPKNT